MSWEIDTPEIPIQKPVEVEKLEQLSPSQREAMDPEEVKFRVYQTANAIARAYKDHHRLDQESFIAVIAKALTTMGYAFGGKFGAEMIAHSDHAAREAWKNLIPEEEQNLD